MRIEVVLDCSSDYLLGGLLATHFTCKTIIQNYYVRSEWDSNEFSPVISQSLAFINSQAPAYHAFNPKPKVTNIYQNQKYDPRDLGSRSYYNIA